MIVTIYEFGREIGRDSSSQGFLEISFFLVVTIAFYVLIMRYCLFKTDWLVDKLHLDKGFIEERFEIKMHRSTILKIAVIVIGGVMVIDTLPLLCKQTFAYFQLTSTTISFKENPASGWIIFYFVKFSIGFFMMTSSRLIVNFIERKRKGPVAATEANAE